MNNSYFSKFFRLNVGGYCWSKLTSCLSFIYVTYFYSFEKVNLMDAPLPWQMNFQQPASPTMEGIVDLHNNIMIFMVYIVIFISYLLMRSVMLFNSTKKTSLDPISKTRHHLSLEIIWTIIPLIILFWIALPSFALLYSVDHCPKVDLTIKVIGRQWYWTYEIDAFLKHKAKKLSYTDVEGAEDLLKKIKESMKNPHLNINNERVRPYKNLSEFDYIMGDINHPRFGEVRKMHEANNLSLTKEEYEAALKDPRAAQAVIESMTEAETAIYVTRSFPKLIANLKLSMIFDNFVNEGLQKKQSNLKNKFYHHLVEFDSCIVSDNEVFNNYLTAYKNINNLNLKDLPTSFCGWWRLLEVDNRLVLPIKTRLRVLVTSSDVLHSWAVPSLGVKIDACPGRLNCVYVYIKRPGIFHGQCSELCGVKHGFMPIVVHGVTRDKYNRWFADTCELVS